MSGSLQWQIMDCEFLISLRFQSFLREREVWTLYGFYSGHEFVPITAGHVERGRLEWVGYATAASGYHQIWLRWWMRQQWPS